MSNSKDTKKSGGAKLNFLFILGLILAILIIVFGLANQQEAEINFLIGKELTINIVLLIFLCIILGSLLTLLFSLPGVFRRRKARKALEKELKDLRKQYEELAKINPISPTK